MLTNHQEPTQKVTTGDAFEDVLYGSESEVDDSEVDEPRNGKATVSQRSLKAQKKGKSQISDGTRLRMDNDEPMDLLEGAAGKFAGMFLRCRQISPLIVLTKPRVISVTGSLVRTPPSLKQTKTRAR